MITKNIKSEKLTYTPPMVESIKLDNEISLAMASGPPEGGDDEVQNNIPNFMNTNPFKSDNC